jgi:hypothetical protein
MNEIQTTENIDILDLSNKNIKDSDNIFEHLSKFPELEEVFNFFVNKILNFLISTIKKI